MGRSVNDLDREIEAYLSEARTPPRFVARLSDRGRASLTLRSDDYHSILRRVSSELLGSGGSHAEIYDGDRLVAVAGRQRRRVRSGALK